MGWEMKDRGVSYIGVNEKLNILISHLEMAAYYRFGIQGGWMLQISSYSRIGHICVFVIVSGGGVFYWGVFGLQLPIHTFCM